MHASEVVKGRLQKAGFNGKFLVWGYQVLFAEPLDSSIPDVLCFKEVYCMLVEGTMEYYHTERIRFGKSGTPGANNSLDVRTTPDGLWLLLACPADLPDVEPETTLKSAVAFLGIWAGRNAVYDCYFEFSLDIKNNQVGIWTPTALNPTGLGNPDFKKFGDILSASVSLQKMPANDRTKLMFSLECYYRYLSLTGAEAFVELWIAFESGTMTSTNVKSANLLLSQTYGITTGDAHKQLLTGRLQGVRNRIVHHGDYRNIQIILIDYLSALYEDVVLFRLLGTCRRKALSLLKTDKAQLLDALRAST